MAQVILTYEESLKYFHNALCNVVSTNYMNGYGLKFDYSDYDYKQSKDHLVALNADKTVCIEDVWIQMLKDGYTLTYLDMEGEGDNTASINLQQVLERVQLTPIENLSAMMLERDDASDSDILIQKVFFGEVIFG